MTQLRWELFLASLLKHRYGRDLIEQFFRWADALSALGAQWGDTTNTLNISNTLLESKFLNFLI